MARRKKPRIRLFALAIVVAGAAVYGNALDGPFLLDDEIAIVTNPQIRQLSPLSEALSPPRDTPVARRPLVNLTFAMNYAEDGLDVTGYRVVNIAIHVLAALVLFGIVRRTVDSTEIAFVSALIWVLHPLNSDAVNYATQRTESLMALFYLLTLYLAIRGWTVASIAACAAGMLCKESMVTAPLMLVLYDRIFRFDSLRAAFQQRKTLYIGLASTWVLLAALMVTVPRTTVGFDGETSPWVYLLNQFEIIARYLWLTIWPRPLVIDYGLPRALTLGDVWPQALLLAALGIAALVALVRWPKAGFLAVWFFVTLAPTSSIVPIHTEVGAERRMYLPLAALVVLAVVLADRKGPRRIPNRARSAAARTFTVRVATAVVVCLLLATGTVLRNREYQSRMRMAETVVERWPSGRGHFFLGNELVEAGRTREAMEHLRVSARDYGYAGAHFALGTELLAAGMIAEAITELETFLRLMPEHPSAIPAHDLAGRAYLATGQVDRAVPHFKSVLAQPDYPFRKEVAGFLAQIEGVKDR